jgi:hypothetical protein
MPAAIGQKGVAQRRAPPTSSTEFDFEHKVFRLDGGCFKLNASGEPLFHVRLGELTAALTLPSLCTEFGIAPNCHDGQLLDIVASGLRYVREIRPGDSIPREILDGSASWSIDDRHRVRAHTRVLVHLAAWLNGENNVVVDVNSLENLANDPDLKQRAQLAFEDIAAQLGLGPDRKQEIVDKIDIFARELAYIEALRDRFELVKAVAVNISRLSKLYARDRSVIEELVRIQTLIRRPLNDLQGIFDVIEGQTAEIVSVLKSFQTQVDFIREMRDELHFRLRDWDELVTKWDGMSIDRTPEAETLIKDTYRFAARQFPLQQAWK